MAAALALASASALALALASALALDLAPVQVVVSALVSASDLAPAQEEDLEEALAVVVAEEEVVAADYTAPNLKWASNRLWYSENVWFE